MPFAAGALMLTAEGLGQKGETSQCDLDRRKTRSQTVPKTFCPSCITEEGVYVVATSTTRTEGTRRIFGVTGTTTRGQKQDAGRLRDPNSRSVASVARPVWQTSDMTTRR